MNLNARYAEHFGTLTDERLGQLKRHGIERRRLGFGSSHTVVYYPPTTSAEMMDKSPDEIVEDFGGGPVDVYLHVPFCEFPCTFCHYATKTVVSGQVAQPDLRFIDLIVTEAVFWQRKCTSLANPLRMGSLYAGGGTGFILDPGSLARLVKGVMDIIPPVPRGFQFCIESSASALCRADSADKLRLLKKAGLNRVSIGVQTVSDDLLLWAGRGISKGSQMNSGNRAQEVASLAVKAALAVVPEVNVDLMQDISDSYSLDTMERDLEWFVGSGATSLTFYIERLHPGSSAFSKESSHLAPTCERTRKSAGLRLAAMDFLSSSGFTPGPGGRFTKTKAKDIYKESRGTQKATLIGFGRSAYSRLGDHFFRAAVNSKEWEDRVTRRGTGAHQYHFVTAAEGIEGKLIAGIREGMKVTQFESLVGTHPSSPYRHRVSELIRGLQDCGVLKVTDGVLHLSPLGSAFEEEVCWLLYSEENRTRTEKFYGVQVPR